MIWLYDDEDQARHVGANPPPSRLYQELRVARAGNIVVLYVDDTDAPRLFAALARLSED